MKRLISNFFLFLLIIYKVDSQCTFQSAFASTTWLDANRGTLTFTDTTMSGFSFTAFSQTISTWECLDNSDELKLVMKATQTLTYSTTTIYTYLCITLTKLSDVSYTYVQSHNQEANAGEDRLKFSSFNTLTSASEICDTSAVIPTLEFQVLVKQGSAALAAIQCPDNFLFTGDYSYSDGTTTACDSSTDVWDTCSNITEMTFDYTTCTQQIAYSAGGKLWCVATQSMSSYECVVVYNQDTSIVSGNNQFACLCTDGSTASVAPGNCTADQDVTNVPTDADSVTKIGHLLTIGTKTVPTVVATAAEESSGLSTGVIVAIVLIVLILIAVGVALGIYCYLRKKNRVTERDIEKPMLRDTSANHARAETVNETFKATREKSNISQKSLIQRNMTLNSIGLEEKSLKREKSNVTVINVEPVEDKKEPKFQILGKDLSFLVCCSEKPQQKEPEKKIAEPLVVETKPKPTKGVSGKKKDGKSKAAGKTKGKAKGKGGKKGKGDTDVNKEKEDLALTDVENEEVVAPKSPPKSPKKKKTDINTTAASEANNEADVNPKSPSKSPNKKKTNLDTTVLSDEVKDETVVALKSSPKSPKKKKTEPLSNSNPPMTSTPIPDSIKNDKFMSKSDNEPDVPAPKSSDKSPKMSKKKGVTNGLKGREKSTVSVISNGMKTPGPVSLSGITSSMVKPSEKSNDWTFLVCCFGNRSPPTQVDHADEEDAVDTTIKKDVKAKAPAKGKPGNKKGAAKKGPTKKAAGGKKSKEAKAEIATDTEKNGSAKEATAEKPSLDRAKSMPGKPREKTTLSLIDAEKVKVDVYIPDDKTKLQLKDTVTVVSETKLEKSKTTLGITRPQSSASQKSHQSASPAKKGKTDKSEKGKGGKEKKGKKNKKKK